MYKSESVKKLDQCLVILELKVVWGVVEVCHGISGMFLLQGHGQKGCLGLYVVCGLKHNSIF